MFKNFANGGNTVGIKSPTGGISRLHHDTLVMIGKKYKKETYFKNKTLTKNSRILWENVTLFCTI